MSSSDRALINAFREINGMADRINLAKTIVDRANNLFKQVHDGKNLKGRSNDAIASACLYIACRQEGVPRTFKVIDFLLLTNFQWIESLFTELACGSHRLKNWKPRAQINKLKYDVLILIVVVLLIWFAKNWWRIFCLQEICAVSKISKKEIGRCFKLILAALETKVDLITTGDFMSRFCSNLGTETIWAH